MSVRVRHPAAQIARVVSALLRGLLVCVLITLVDAPAAPGQAAVTAELAAAIPAQPLAQALAAFAEQTGIQLVYVSGVVIDQKSRAVPAGLKPEEALARMLQGTGLRFEYLTPHSIRILKTAPAPKMTLRGSLEIGSQAIIVVDVLQSGGGI